jgi:hypothetical protein
MSSKESTESAEPAAESAGTPDTETAEAEVTRTEKAGQKTAVVEMTDERTADIEAVNKHAEKGGGGRAGVVIAAVLLLACGGLVSYGVLNTEDSPKPSPATPAAEVTYEVTGAGPVEISYLARSEDGAATVVRGAELPWKKTVRVPLGEAPAVAVVLGEKGGRAACTLAIRGKHVQRATAMGEFGRATCAGELPATDN